MATGKRKAKFLPTKTIDQYFVKSSLPSPTTPTSKKNTTDENAKSNSQEDRRPLALVSPKIRQPLADIGGSAVVVSCQKTTPSRATFAVLRDEDISQGLDEAPQPKAALATQTTVTSSIDTDATHSLTPPSSPHRSSPLESLDDANASFFDTEDDDATPPLEDTNHSLQTQSVPLLDSLASHAASSPTLSMSSPLNHASQEDDSDDDAFFDDVFITRTKRPQRTPHERTPPALKRANQSTEETSRFEFDDKSDDDDDGFGGLIPPHSPFFDPVSSPEGNNDVLFPSTIEFSISNSLDEPERDDKPNPISQQRAAAEEQPPSQAQASFEQKDRTKAEQEHTSAVQADSQDQLAQTSQPAMSDKEVTSPERTQDYSLHPTLPYPQLEQFVAHVPYPVPRGKTILEKFGIKKDQPDQ